MCRKSARAEMRCWFHLKCQLQGNGGGCLEHWVRPMLSPIPAQWEKLPCSIRKVWSGIRHSARYIERLWEGEFRLCWRGCEEIYATQLPGKIYRNNNNLKIPMHSKTNEPVLAIFWKTSRHNWHNLRQNGDIPNTWQRANHIHTILQKNVPRNIKKGKPKYDYRSQRSEHLRWHSLIDPPCCQVTRQAENKAKILRWELKNPTDTYIATDTGVLGFSFVFAFLKDQ